MEIFLHVYFITLLWFLSSTVFLPFIFLLMWSKTVVNMWFSFIYTNILMPFLEPKITANRERLFKMLEEEMSSRDKNVPLKFLEIGVGYGANLQFYPENSKLTVLDMNPSFEIYFRRHKEKYPQVELEGIVHGMAENMKEISDNSMDVVISTYVLCSVTDVDRALEEIKRVLKPGGKFFFVEHVIYEDFGWHYLLQRAICPLWQIYFDGCEPDRDHKRSMDKAGFTRISYERFICKISWLYIRPNFIGVATK